MGIVLVGATSLATINYLNPSIAIEKQSETRLVKGFDSLQTAWDAYRLENQTHEWMCDTYTTANGTYEDCYKILADPGHLPVSGWSQTLTPEFTFMPVPPRNMLWSYGSSGADLYFCVQGSVNAPQIRGLHRGLGHFMGEQAFIGNSCGVTASTPDNMLEADNVGITYWVKRN